MTVATRGSMTLAIDTPPAAGVPDERSASVSLLLRSGDTDKRTCCATDPTNRRAQGLLRGQSRGRRPAPARVSEASAGRRCRPAAAPGNMRRPWRVSSVGADREQDLSADHMFFFRTRAQPIPRRYASHAGHHSRPFGLVSWAPRSASGAVRGSDQRAGAQVDPRYCARGRGPILHVHAAPITAAGNTAASGDAPRAPVRRAALASAPCCSRSGAHSSGGRVGASSRPLRDGSAGSRPRPGREGSLRARVGACVPGDGPAGRASIGRRRRQRGRRGRPPGVRRRPPAGPVPGDPHVEARVSATACGGRAARPDGVLRPGRRREEMPPRRSRRASLPAPSGCGALPRYAGQRRRSPPWTGGVRARGDAGGLASVDGSGGGGPIG